MLTGVWAGPGPHLGSGRFVADDQGYPWLAGTLPGRRQGRTAALIPWNPDLTVRRHARDDDAPGGWPSRAAASPTTTTTAASG